MNYENNQSIGIKETQLTFSQALDAIKKGKKVARAIWDFKSIFIFLVPGSDLKVNRPPLLDIYPEGTSIVYDAHIDIRSADGVISPWNPTHVDMLSSDWEIVTVNSES